MTSTQERGRRARGAGAGPDGLAEEHRAGPDHPATSPSPDAACGARGLSDALRQLERVLRRCRVRASPSTLGAAGAAGAASAAERALLHCVLDAGAPPGVGEVARRLHRDPSSVSVIATKLVARGLLRRQSAPTDRRRILLALTPAGRRLAARAPDRLQASLDRALAGWSADRVRRSVRLLAELAEALDRPDAGAPRSPGGGGARGAPVLPGASRYSDATSSARAGAPSSPASRRGGAISS